MKGDVIANLVDITALGSIPIQPPSGEEWLITNIGSAYWGGTDPYKTPRINIAVTNGTLEAIAYKDQEANHFLKQPILITNSFYIKVYDTQNANGTISYTGVKTK